MIGVGERTACGVMSAAGAHGVRTAAEVRTTAEAHGEMTTTANEHFVVAGFPFVAER
jgi:hypothetical protein